MKETRFGQALIRTKDGQNIYCKTQHQYELVQAIENSQIIICDGPAGTGKTFLATVMAAKYLKEGTVKKIVVTRPAVPAGENLGYLPGEVSEKMAPYLRPIYDILDMIDIKQPQEKKEEAQKQVGRKPKNFKEPPAEVVKYTNQIELLPYAYMRGVTLNDSFILADESQNSTVEQLYMIMTRIGYGSKMVIDGDVLQSDIRGENGLKYLIDRLDTKIIDGISFVQFDDRDIVRNPIIRDIEKLFGK